MQTKKVCYHRMEQNLSLRSESMTEKITAADAIRLLDSGKAVACLLYTSDAADE